MSRQSKKVIILTHKLGPNYGGILQAYALQSYVRKLLPGVSIETTHLQPAPGLIRRAASISLNLIKRRSIYVSTLWMQRVVQRETLNFITNHMTCTTGLDIDGDAYIVGSDQVWRAAYADPLRYMFSDIEASTSIKISYAASFGTDDLSEFSEYQIKRSGELAGKFSAISVREDSGVDIARKSWGLQAEHHIDPTLLLAKEEYSALIGKGSTIDLGGSLFAYVLDRSATNEKIIAKIEALSHTKKFELMPAQYDSLINFLLNKDAYRMPGVEQWLKSFRDAEYIVTDSFHGTVFSIIFNKPFTTIGNKSRGLARFESLLRMFGLEDRLVTSIEDVTGDLATKDIDWVSVNAKIKSEQKRSFDYLKKHLG